jgi:hypothetical protein
VLLLGMLLGTAAAAQQRLVPFTEANGCKLLGAASAIARLTEIASQGAVTWTGQCKEGLIEGPGVLREEGSVGIDGKTKKYAYFLSGSARKGVRQGQWRRETFDKFVDSPRFYTSAASLTFVDGVARGRLKLIPITRIDQLTPAFRQFVIAAQRDATPANAALLQAPASPPPPVAQTAPKPPSTTPAANPQPSASTQRAGGLPLPKVTASSQLEKYGPEGLLSAAQPGWHAAMPPKYPESLIVDFGAPREIRRIGLLPQDGVPERAPKQMRIEISNDDLYWDPIAIVDSSCGTRPADGWGSIELPKPATTRYLKLMIFTNCGDPQLLTFRGLRFD